MSWMIVSGAAAMSALVLSGTAGAQTLLVDCYKVADQVVACRSSTADGTPVAGADITLYSGENAGPDTGTRLGGGKTDEHGVFLFKAPPMDYTAVVSAGPSEAASQSSRDITAKPHRPGWGGDWIPAAAVTRLQKMQQWQEQFTSERPPLIERIERELTK